MLAVIHQEGLNILDKLHWGLVPFWAKDTNVGSKMINARQETVSTKTSFREAFKKRRCLILADGVYEWYGTKGQKKPVFITLPSGKRRGNHPDKYLADESIGVLSDVFLEALPYALSWRSPP